MKCLCDRPRTGKLSASADAGNAQTLNEFVAPVLIDIKRTV